MHCIYEHEGLEYRPRDEEHKSHQLKYEPKHSGNGNRVFECREPNYEDVGQVYIQTSNQGMQKVFTPEVIQLLPELPMLTVLTELPYSCVYTIFWQMHLTFAGAAHKICVNVYTTILSTVAAVISLCHSGKVCKRTCLQRVQPSGFLVRHAFIVDSYRTT